jgi:hypothetical protein
VVAVVAAERQITSLRTYSDAQAYLEVAKGDAAAADRAYGRSLRELGVAKGQEVRALAAKAVAKATVNLYDQALCELGVAEYTGIAETDNLDLASQEREVEQAELGDVAATDTAAGFEKAKTELARSIRLANVARAALAVAKTVAVHNRALLGTARAQLAASRSAVGLARQWVLVPGAAPARPALALAALEGKVALQVKATQLAVLALAIRPVTTTTPATGATAAAPTTAAPTTAAPTTAAPTTAITMTAAGAPAKDQVAAPGVLVRARVAPLSGLTASAPSILGPSVLSASQILDWFASTGARANTTVPITQLVADYMKAGRLTGVRADLAFAQSVVETGYFSFPPGGQLGPKNNNFAGIGACDKCKHGWSFPSAMTGIVAQEELLSQYAGMPREPALSSIGAGGVAGCCTTWMSLAGVWATNLAYGFEILSVYKEMLDWALVGEEQQAGLSPPGAQAPSGGSRLVASPPAKSGPEPSRSRPT